MKIPLLLVLIMWDHSIPIWLAEVNNDWLGYGLVLVI